MPGREDGGLAHGDSPGEGEKWLALGDRMKTEPTGPADEMTWM